MATIDHLDLVVSDLERSLRFYTDLLAPFGDGRHSQITGERGERVVYVSSDAGPQISVRERQSDRPVDRYAIGLHHLAFRAPTREVVDERAAWLRARPRDRERARGVPLHTRPLRRERSHARRTIKLEIVHQPDA